RDRDREASRDGLHRVVHGVLLQSSKPTLSLVADVVRDFRFDMLRGDLLADVFRGIGYPLPQSINRGRQLCAATLGFDSQLLHGSCHGACPHGFRSERTHALMNGSSVFW